MLVVVRGTELGRRYPLTASELVIGRDAARSKLVIADTSVSATHAKISVDREQGRYEIVDLDSRNGTFVNGERVSEGSLCVGDRLQLGSTILEFAFHGYIENCYHDELQRLMHEDSLTGLYQRGWFDRQYPREFERAKRDGLSLTVLMLDMDGLKEVNDEHGHLMGSHCISETGRIIKACVGANGCAARFGGDEFAVFFPGIGLDDAIDIAEDIRRKVEQHRFHLDGISVQPTISIGATELQSDIRSHQELIQLADAALYRAKKAGRNRVSE